MAAECPARPKIGPRVGPDRVGIEGTSADYLGESSHAVIERERTADENLDVMTDMRLT
jgi:hypothetical protein